MKSRLVILLLVVLNLALLVKVDALALVQGSIPLWDFDIYYQMAQDVSQGANPYQLPYMQTSGPPLVILFFLPFMWLPLQVARSSIFILNILAVMGTASVLAHQIPRARIVPLMLIINAGLLLCFPVRFNFTVGQPNLILMWLVSLMLTTTSQNLNGILAAVLAVIKTNYVVVIASFIKSQRRSLMAAVGVISVIGLLSLLLFSPQVYREYWQSRASEFVFEAPLPTNLDYYNQSFRATMARLHWPEFYSVTFILAALGAIIYLIKSGNLESGIVLSLLLSPIIWQHYLPVVYPVLFMVGRRVWPDPHWRWGWVVSSILLIIHLRWLHAAPAQFPMTLLASHYFVGLLLLGVLTIVRPIRQREHENQNS